MELKEVRHYIRVAPFALASVLSALDKDKEHARKICVSLEDDELLVSYSEAPRRKCGVVTSEDK